ncbi:MAG: LysR family transcriptional regulator [Reyranella sp.]|nr:LysR family transcriptional regulator [Reyranella sp.]
MITLADLRFIEALARAGSLSGAARALNVTPPALSMRLKKLERSLGLSLVVRSSRRVRFTGEGEHLVHEAQALLGRIEALPEVLGGEGRGLAGPLRVVAPFGFGRLHVAPMIARFAVQHPAVRVTLDLSEKPWTDSGDADVVIHIGAVRDSTWVAHLLARNARWVCASPAYLRRRGTPADPRDLLQHDCLCVRENNEDVTLWHHRRNGKAAAVRVTPTLTSNDGEVVRNWAIAGLGIVVRSQWDAAPFVRRGELKRVLAAWDFDGADVLALVPARRGISARVSQFVDFLKGDFKRKAPWA